MNDNDETAKRPLSFLSALGFLSFPLAQLDASPNVVSSRSWMFIITFFIFLAFHFSTRASQKASLGPRPSPALLVCFPLQLPLQRVLLELWFLLSCTASWRHLYIVSISLKLVHVSSSSSFLVSVPFSPLFFLSFPLRLTSFSSCLFALSGMSLLARWMPLDV